MRLSISIWIAISGIVMLGAVSSSIAMSSAEPAEPDNLAAPSSQLADSSQSTNALSAPQVQSRAANPPDGRGISQSQTSDLEATALLAGGCFWCIESDFEKLDGVIKAVSGYMGGRSSNPSYKSHVAEGHYEAVAVTYDPSVLSYTEVLVYFFRHVDPTDDGGQFCDRGDSYRTAIFTSSGEEQAIALRVKAAAENELRQKVVTPVLSSSAFHEAEEYHQDFYLKNPLRYQLYRRGCGRDARLKSLWGDTALSEVR